jgi:hypothetical protein
MQIICSACLYIYIYIYIYIYAYPIDMYMSNIGKYLWQNAFKYCIIQLLCVIFNHMLKTPMFYFLKKFVL